MKSVVSEKGQVTIPKSLRERLGLRPGTTLEFSERAGVLMARKREEKGLAAIYGILPAGDPDEIVRRARGADWTRRSDPEGLGKS
ncbi:MAG TPA: AbrB/MazE/SpoVT family DNA-binding domain-containing protein [Terriglobales bacterium]|nr:AbrB/MazE/SpoVT family DNA-binding domain-containing protein [Terriglobales bacterium]